VTEITASEFARRLGVDKATAVRWLHAGKVQGWQTPGGHWRIAESEVERVRSHGRTPAAAASSVNAAAIV
jgi:excisionase family DNA binding protein